MTDKENNNRIIVDDVNIIGCDYYYIEQATDQVKCDNYGGYCQEHKNCPFKQLARKKQECEELEDFRTLVRELFTFGDSDVDDEHFIKYLKEDCKSSQEALDGYCRLTDITGIDYTVHGGADIEEIVKRVDSLKHECEELKNNLHIANTNHEAAEKECDRYLKALEEIKKVCIEDTREFADGTQVRYDSLDEILRIINKAKDGNDE